VQAGRLWGTGDQGRAPVVGDLPPDDHPGGEVDDCRPVEPARARAQIRDVADQADAARMPAGAQHPGDTPAPVRLPELLERLAHADHELPAARGYGCVIAKKAAAFFRNPCSNRSLRISSSISATRARSRGVRALSGSGLPCFHSFTQLPSVPSPASNSRAMPAIGRPVTMTT
jgi:hypothetical protein